MLTSSSTKSSNAIVTHASASVVIFDITGELAVREEMTSGNIAIVVKCRNVKEVKLLNAVF